MSEETVGKNMSDRKNGFDSQFGDLFDYEEFVSMLTQLLAERLSQSETISKGEERKLIDSRRYYRHGTLVVVRKALSVTTIFFLSYCLVNTFTQVFT
ncbi:MAG: hypothetical protein SAK42_04160, partial [Oscillatoria sp. PMC 1076.18]|nr:hypothetical protein [Oscillatoria sp. PMC 1076.18]